MGCNSRLWLPPETRAKDVAEVLAILLGATAERRKFTQAEGWACHVSEPLVLETTSVPEMLLITGKVAGKQVLNHWFWESDSGPAGYRLMTCGSYQERRPALERLADFFGGTLDMDDCDSVDADFMGSLRGKPYRLDASDGDAWYAFQEAKVALNDDRGRPYAWPS